jgi:hypothetical protein
MHSFTLARAAEVSTRSLARSGQAALFLLMELVAAQPQFASGFNAWQKEQPSQHNHEDWRPFWSRVNTYWTATIMAATSAAILIQIASAMDCL